MIKPIIMPKLGETVEETKIVSWLKKEGDWIDKGDPLFEAETDKVSIEVESLASGYLRRRLYGDGDTVGVTLPIAYLADTIEEPLPGTEPGVARLAASIDLTPRREGIGSAAGMRGASPAGSAQPSQGAAQATPVAKRLARERGVDLALVKGSGPGGRITERDVLAFVPSPGLAVEPAAQQPTSLSGMRRRIAERMVDSKSTAPHFYLTMRIDVSRAVALRARLKGEGRSTPSYDGLVVAAVAKALRAHPALNSSFAEDGIKTHSQVALGVAVSLDDGLVVPVVRDADCKSALTITREIEQLAVRARANKLAPADYEGGTFTISNLGMYPVDEFVAIINPPQAAILALGRVSLEPVAVSTEMGNMLGFAHLMSATLSVDHRVTDGAAAARFLSAIKEQLEKPERLEET